MADTTSPLLGLLLMGTGGDNNSWGINLNNNVIALLEQAVAGSVLINSTGGTYTLTDDESRNATIIIQGSMTSTLTIIVPARSKRWSFYNDSDGVVLVKTAAQATGVNLPLRRETKCFFDFTSNIVRREDASRVGELFYHAAATAPAGAMVCNGALILRANYPDLYGIIGTTWGIGDNFTTFGLPNGQDTGRYLRSSSGSLAVGTYQTSQNKAHTHTGSGTTSGVSAFHSHTGSGTTGGMNSNASHSHTASAVGQVVNGGVGGAGNFNSGPYSTPGINITIAATNTDHGHNYSFTTSGDSVDHTHTYSFTTSGGSADGAEARPESLVGLLCIRY